METGRKAAGGRRDQETFGAQPVDTFSAEEKIRVVLEGLRGEESIAELCRREGIASSMVVSRFADEVGFASAAFLRAAKEASRSLRMASKPAKKAWLVTSCFRLKARFSPSAMAM